ncbi:hypothetical protein [Paenibacillus dendritiformis]|uniref:hypothetical protein n=1 Tax=Paenibacillus dendritiformis TaxID=130049 RepID=UPI00387E1EBF
MNRQPFPPRRLAQDGGRPLGATVSAATNISLAQMRFLPDGPPAGSAFCLLAAAL